MEKKITSQINGMSHEAWQAHQHDVWNRRSGAYTNLDWVKNQDFMSKMVLFAEPDGRSRALDIGTGPGVVASVVSQFVPEVIGIDISEEMLAQARERNLNNPRVKFVQSDVESMDFPDDYFDMATARMVFHHVADCAAGMAEVFRVMAPGGSFVLCEGVPPDHLTRRRYEEIFALKEERHTFSEAELINMFDRAGFENILVMPHFMRQVSLNNWLGNGDLAESVIEEIKHLHLDADDHFKNAYRLSERDGDILMDWKFIIIRGMKPVSGDA